MRVYNICLGTRVEPPAGSRGRDPGQESGEAISFLTVERPQETANLAPLLYFAKSVLSKPEVAKFLVTIIIMYLFAQGSNKIFFKLKQHKRNTHTHTHNTKGT